MTRRAAALLLTGPPATGGCPPGVDPAAFARAMAEDVVDLLADLASVESFVIASAAAEADARALAWSADQVLVESADPTPAVTITSSTQTGAFGALVPGVLGVLRRRGIDEVALVAADAPDLPGLMVAKTFSALRSAPVAVAPARGGGLVVLACRLPVPAWLAAVGIDLDAHDAAQRLREGAPSPEDVVSTPGWRRLREPGDLAALDPGLEGWEATRALLDGSAARRQ